MSNWYDAVYGDDPSTENIFGREALVPRHASLLHDSLRRGGRLSQFARHAEAGNVCSSVVNTSYATMAKW